MAKQTWVKVDGVWKPVKDVWTKVSGTWKNNVVPKGKISGEWKEFMEYAPPWPDKDGYLYYYGQYEDMWVTGSANQPGTQSKELDHLLITLNPPPAIGPTAERTWVTDVPVEVDEFTNLHIVCGSDGDLEVNFNISDAEGSYYIRLHSIRSYALPPGQFSDNYHIVLSTNKEASYGVYDYRLSSMIRTNRLNWIYAVQLT